MKQSLQHFINPPFHAWTLDIPEPKKPLFLNHEFFRSILFYLTTEQAKISDGWRKMPVSAEVYFARYNEPVFVFPDMRCKMDCGVEFLRFGKLIMLERAIGQSGL